MKETGSPEQGIADRGGRPLSIFLVVGVVLVAAVLVVGLTAFAVWTPQAGVPTEPSAPGPALAWHREGGLAGFCEDVIVHASGDVYLYSCRGEQPVEVGRTRLDAGQLAVLARWLDTLQPFEYELSNPDTADAMTERLAFAGEGGQPAQDTDRQLILEFARNLYKPLDTLIQLDWEGGFAPPEVSVPFGRVPHFTLLSDGRVFYVDQGEPLEPFEQQLMVAQLSPVEAQELVQQVLDLGFEGLESHLDWCQESANGDSQCVADAGYSILRVRLPGGDLREIRNWADFANDPKALIAIRSLLSEYRHPQAQPYLSDKASLFIQPMLSAEGVTVNDWPLDPAWLASPDPVVEQWAGILDDTDRDMLLQVTSRNMGTHYFRYGERFYQVVLVPWLPGTDYTDLVIAYRWP